MPTDGDFKTMITLLRSCGAPQGKGIGEWGARWAYHFEPDGRWVKGKVRRPGGMMGQHGGVDLLAAVGTPQLCPADGVVFKAGWQDQEEKAAGYGLRVMVILNDPKGYILTGGHFESLVVMGGDVVKRGQLLGYSGMSGNATGPHIHWQLEKPGPFPRTPVPFEFVDA